MDDPGCVRYRQGFRDLDGQAKRLPEWHTVAAHGVAQSLADKVLLHHEVDTTLLPDVEDRRDMRVIQGGRRPCLPLEPSQSIGVLGELRRKHLDGYLPVQARVLREVHLAHPASAKLFVDLVGA